MRRFIKRAGASPLGRILVQSVLLERWRLCVLAE